MTFQKSSIPYGQHLIASAQFDGGVDHYLKPLPVFVTFDISGLTTNVTDYLVLENKFYDMILSKVFAKVNVTNASYNIKLTKSPSGGDGTYFFVMDNEFSASLGVGFHVLNEADLRVNGLVREGEKIYLNATNIQIQQLNLLFEPVIIDQEF